MHGQLVWTTPLKDELRKLWLAGWTAERIRIAFMGQFTRNAIIGAARRLGLPGRPNPVPVRIDHEAKPSKRQPVRIFTDDMIPALEQMWKSRIKSREIAKHFGCCLSTIESKAKEIGLRERDFYRSRQTQLTRSARPYTDAPQEPLGEPLNLPMAALVPGQCKFAVNNSKTTSGHLFCGLPAIGHVYCAAHRVVAAGAVRVMG